MPRLGKGTTEAELVVESIARQVPGWAGRDIAYAPAVVPVASPMQRGVDGDCWRVEIDACERFFLKIPAADSIHFIDAAASIAAAAGAGELGVAPRLVWSDPARGAAIWEYLGDGWRTANLSDLGHTGIMQAIIELKRSVHRGCRFGRTRSVFDLAESYAADAAGRGLRMPGDYAWMLSNVRAIAAAVAAAGFDLAACHGDGIASNVMIGREGQVRVVDWDEATNADPYWDLGSLFAEAFPFDPPARAAFEHYHGRLDEALFARCRLYGVADDLAWGTRSLVAAAVTERLDIEFFKYAQWRFLRCRMEMHDRRFEERLRAL